jgi:hypothetical protein
MCRAPTAFVTAGLCMYCWHYTPTVQSTLHYTGASRLKLEVPRVFEHHLLLLLLASTAVISSEVCSLHVVSACACAVRCLCVSQLPCTTRSTLAAPQAQLRVAAGLQRNRWLHTMTHTMRSTVDGSAAAVFNKQASMLLFKQVLVHWQLLHHFLRCSRCM